MTEPQASASGLQDLSQVEQTFEVLEYLADSAGIEFHPGSTREQLHQAERDLPGWEPGLVWTRLERVAQDCGLRLTRRHWSVREVCQAVQAGGTILGLRAGGPSPTPWVLLVAARGEKIQVAGVDPQGLTWLSIQELATLVGANEVDTPVEWGLGQAATPFTGTVVEPGGSGGGHGGGQGGGEGEGPGDGHGSPHGLSPFRRLVAMLRPEKPDLWMVVMFAIGVGVLSLAVPFTVQAIVDTLVTVADPTQRSQVLGQQVVILSLVLLGCLGVATLLRVLKYCVVELMQQRIFVRVAGDLAFRLPRVRSEAFDHKHGPELVNRFFDVLTVQKAGAVLLLDGVVVFLQGSIGLIVLGVYHWSLLYFDMALILAIVFIAFILGRGAVRTSIDESMAKYAVAGWLEEIVRHPVAFKQGGAQRYALDRTDDLARGYLAARQSHFRVLLRQNTAALLLQAFASAGLLGLGGFLVMEGTLLPGQLVAAELIVAVIVGSIVKLGKSLESFYDLLAAVSKLGQLVDLPLERGAGETGPLQAAQGVPARVRMHHVSFQHDGMPATPGLTDLNLHLDSGEAVALLGPQASGKSTIAELLFGMRTPQHGYIELDGVDLRDLRLEVVREHVALVKTCEIFEGTVVENVRLGRHHIGLNEVRQALQAVDLLEEIQALPQGLQTWLPTGGRPLSSGQALRLMLARALAGKPRLLILDETLDDLDERIRLRILAHLTQAHAPWTLLVITHDPEVARMCARQITLNR